MWQNTRAISTKKLLKLSPQNGGFSTLIKEYMYVSSSVWQKEHSGDSIFLSLKSTLFTKKHCLVFCTEKLLILYLQ